MEKAMKRDKSALPKRDQIEAIIRRYNCPKPYHSVRAFLLGNVASPALTVSPIKAVEQLWGGELPIFEKEKDAEEFFQVLLGGLWNRMSQHQDRKSPFHLIKIETTPTRESLLSFARIRQEEIDSFIDGFFGSSDQVDIPESASGALERLGESRGMFAATASLAKDASIAAPLNQIELTIKLLSRTTLIAENEINAIILSCKKARAHFIETSQTKKPTFH